MATIEHLQSRQKTVDKIQFLLSGEAVLRSKELDFLSSMDALIKRGRTLSVKQNAWLESIYNRVLFHGNDQ